MNATNTTYICGIMQLDAGVYSASKLDYLYQLFVSETLIRTRVSVSTLTELIKRVCLVCFVHRMQQDSMVLL